MFRLVWAFFQEAYQLNSDERCRARNGQQLTFQIWRDMLHQERWARLVTTNEIAKAHQEKLNGQYDWLSAGYCTAYGLLITGLVVPWLPTMPWSPLSSASTAFPPSCSWLMVALGSLDHLEPLSTTPGPVIFFLGLLALFCAVAGDYRITEIEWWLNERFPQLKKLENLPEELRAYTVTISPIHFTEGP